MKLNNNKFVASCACCAFALLLNQPVHAADDPQDPATTAQSATSPSDAPSADQPDSTPSEGKLSRWLDLNALSFSLRYRNSFDTDGVHTFNDIQQRSLVSGKFKIDKDGKYFVGFRAASGRYFNWSYANISGLDYKQSAAAGFAGYTPQRQAIVLNAFYHDPLASEILANEAARGWEFYVRDLYLSATPVKGVTFEFGAIPIERGVGSEITTFDEDGYISGERVRVRAPEL